MALGPTLASWLVSVAVFAAAAAAPVVRDERVVAVDGKPETWRLEWVTPPRPACGPTDIGSFTCPCMGFAFGEQGELDLVRLRSAREVERLHLTPFFADEDTPAWKEEHAVLRRWPILENDYAEAEAGPQPFAERVRKRTPVPILEVADWNRDGWAAEFVLQVGVAPCGKRRSLLVGVSRGRQKLHAFGTAEHPEKPLMLYGYQWEQLRVSKGPSRIVSWPCGDHESGVQTELVLSVDAAGIHALREEFSCDQGIKLDLRSREVL